MDIKEFIDNFSEVLDDVDPSELTPETKFRDLDDWSSIYALGLITMLMEEYDVQLSGKEFQDAETIQDLFDAVKAKV